MAITRIPSPKPADVLGTPRAESAPKLGAHVDPDTNTLSIAVYSENATHMRADLFAAPTGEAAKVSVPLAKAPGTEVWVGEVSLDKLQAQGIGGALYYGLRTWGPNWEYDTHWTPGSLAGFKEDVDGLGNRFNPNKLAVDPHALELSNDTLGVHNTDGSVFASGDGLRQLDSAGVAPKGVVIEPATAPVVRPKRPAKDDVIYEVHVKGLTANDPSIPKEIRGTYKGIIAAIPRLKALGVTAIELLPVQETTNDQNDLDPTSTRGDNYWGYMTLNYFAPDRRFSSNKSPGGPTREFQEMVKALHEADIKVYVDMVYNHTGEGGLWSTRDATASIEAMAAPDSAFRAGDPNRASLLSFRAIDNRTYYQLEKDPRYYFDQTGCGANVKVAKKPVQDLVVDSLRYWHETLGVDGVRFDLAAVLGNGTEGPGFSYDRNDPNNLLNRIARELPGLDLIAEPWSIGAYLAGQFPEGWGEWNGKFRDVVRVAMNRATTEPTPPGALAVRIAGSDDLFGDRAPWRSVNFVNCHDGFTLKDLVSFNEKNNNQAWPYGPSDGGENNNVSWDHGGNPALQRQGARNAVALTLLAAGRPMINGGDEALRSLNGNNNAYNLDSEANWLDPADQQRNGPFYDFTRGMIAFRKAHPALRRDTFFHGRDENGNQLKDITWHRPNGDEADGQYMGDPSNRYLGWRIDGTEVEGESARSIFVGYSYGPEGCDITLPAPAPGHAWYRVADTSAWMEGEDNLAAPGHELPLDAPSYKMHGRSVTLFIEKPLE